MVTPVYKGFMETRGVLRNNACGARAAEERELRMMDGIVKKQGGQRGKDWMRRTNQIRRGAAAAIMQMPAVLLRQAIANSSKTIHRQDARPSKETPLDNL